MHAIAQQKDMPNDLCLLFNPVALQGPARLQTIVVAAEGMTSKDKVDALLMLPHMRHLVDEQALPLHGGRAEIRTEQLTLWMKPQMTVRRHGDPAGLEPEPFAIVYKHPAIIDGIPKD